MNKQKTINKIQDLGARIALILLVVVIGIISPEFRTVGNFLSLLRQSSINGLIAFGMTCVILTGGIDLSVGSVLALSTALCAGFISNGMPVGAAMLLALVILQLNVSEGTVAAGVMVIYLLSCFLGGFLLGKGVGKNKFLWGVILGAVYFVLLMILSAAAGSGSFGGSGRIFSTFLLCCAGGMAGGMLA